MDAGRSYYSAQRFGIIERCRRRGYESFGSVICSSCGCESVDTWSMVHEGSASGMSGASGSCLDRTAIPGLWQLILVPYTVVTLFM